MKKLIAIVGLPRSGTTLLTAILDSHPEIECWYEIYSSRCEKELPVYNNFHELYKDYIKCHGENIFKNRSFYSKIFRLHYPFSYFVIKEVNTFPRENQIISGIEYVDSFLNNIQNADKIDIEIIWLLRDFRHIYLSRVEGLQKWWGEPNFVASSESYSEWVDEAHDGLIKIQDFAKKHKTTCITYDSFVTDFEKTIQLLFQNLGINMSDNVFNYDKIINFEKINGDLNVYNLHEYPNKNS